MLNWYLPFWFTLAMLTFGITGCDVVDEGADIVIGVVDYDIGIGVMDVAVTNSPVTSSHYTVYAKEEKVSSYVADAIWKRVRGVRATKFPRSANGSFVKMELVSWQCSKFEVGWS